MCLLYRCLAATQPQYAAKLITCLCAVSASVYQPQRVMVAAVIAEVSTTVISVHRGDEGLQLQVLTRGDLPLLL